MRNGIESEFFSFEVSWINELQQSISELLENKMLNCAPSLPSPLRSGPRRTHIGAQVCTDLIEMEQASDLLPNHLFEYGVNAQVLSWGYSLEYPGKLIKNFYYPDHFPDLLNLNLCRMGPRHQYFSSCPSVCSGGWSWDHLLKGQEKKGRQEEGRNKKGRKEHTPMSVRLKILFPPLPVSRWDNFDD